MAEPPPLETRVTRLERTLAEIEDRVRVIETAAEPAHTATAAPSALPALEMASVDVVGTFALVGRTFVLFAGAYLLRAVTESGVVERSTGAILGLAYAFVLAALAYWVAPRHATSATFFGACTMFIALPLLWEITARFGLLTAATSALALAAISGVILSIAWRRDLPALAWIATVGACLAASGLLVATGAALPFTVFLIALGVATLWLGYDREWTMLRWFAALFADVAVIALLARALAMPPRDDPAQVMAVQMLLLVGYLGSVAIRTLVRKRDVLPFEATQTAAMLLVGLAGAMLLARRTGAGAVLLGPTLLALAAACYAVAFIHRECHARAANYYFYTTLAIVFALTGGSFALDGAAAGLLWLTLAIAIGWYGRRYRRSTLFLHAIAYFVTAAIVTGLAADTFVSLFGVTPAAPFTGIAEWLVIAAGAACWWMAASLAPPASRRIPRAILAFFLIVTAAAVGITAIRALVLAAADVTLQTAIMATVRTGVLAIAAVVIAWLGRRTTTREFGLFVYPVLAWGVLKLVIEDFRVSPPSLLVVAFALYGGALIIAPRIARRDQGRFNNEIRETRGEDWLLDRPVNSSLGVARRQQVERHREDHVDHQHEDPDKPRAPAVVGHQ
jgi:hypothetical protein